MTTEPTNTDAQPHRGQPIRTAGEPLDRARAALVMLHGRGARAEDILTLVDELAQPGLAYLAPQAAGNAWYPNRFMEPIPRNEPWLSSALAFVADTLAQVAAAGIPLERTMLLGFSQGACLALEFAARRARRYGGLVGLSGGLIGPDGTPRNYAGSFAGAPVFLGCSDVDPHIPKERVQHTADVLQQLGAVVTVRLYPNMAHTVNHDEIKFVRTLLVELLREA
ncbi:MAG TPA: dienelactone hydrolase family protein [Anaerolineae bacterium]|nr:dienelactone hydrolase family protein [Anaerolineae bacterium]